MKPPAAEGLTEKESGQKKPAKRYAKKASSRGGARPGAGRKKGIRNRATDEKARLSAEEKAALLASGKSPLEFLLEVMREEPEPRGEDEDPEDYRARCARLKAERTDAAKAAAPYCHPKLAQLDVEHSGSVGVRHEDALAELDDDEPEEE